MERSKTLNRSDFQRRLDEITKYADDVVKSFLPKSLDDERACYSDDRIAELTVTDALIYSVEAGGKRLRPVLMKLIFDLLGGTDKEALHLFMAAIEYIHTYSLVHDDLPAMDNDIYRRGKKTTHAVFGEAMGILAGDALLNYAFEIVFRAAEIAEGQEESLRTIKAGKILASKAGIFGMIGGQCADIESEAGDCADRERALFFIQENKTGALIEAAFMCGAILAGADSEKVDLLEKTGSLIGRAFQIRDDILDEIGSKDRLGKSIGKDKKQNKLTFVSVYSLDTAKKRVEEYTGEAVSRIMSLGAEKDSFLIELLLHLIERDH